MALPGWLTGAAAKTVSTLNTVNNALPGKDTTAGYDLANSIRDPNVTYTGGVGGLFDGQNNFSPAGPSPGVVQAAVTTNPTPPPNATGTAPQNLNAEGASWMGTLPGAISTIAQNGATGFDSAGRRLQSGAENLFNKVRQGQQAINTSRENVELNRLNGVQDILGFVRNGLKSGGARLANMNAGESSAVGELQKAYGSIGGNRMRQVGNETFIQNRNIDTQQGENDLIASSGKNDFARDRDDAVSTIGSQIRAQLEALDKEGQKVGITGKVQIDAEKQRIMNAGMAKLSQIDNFLASQMGSINPQDQATTRTNAIALQQGGKGAATPFDFGQFGGEQVMGAPMDQLPIYTRSRRR